MKKLAILIGLVALSFSSQAQVWSPVGNTLQKQTGGSYSNYRFNLGSPGFAYFYSKQQTDSLFNAAISAGISLAYFNSHTGTSTQAQIDGKVSISELNYLTFEQFGAVGDSLTDNTSAIRATIQAAVDSNKSIWIKDGVYRISGTIDIPSNINMFGNGYNSKIYSPDNIVFFEFTGSNAQVSDLTIEGDTTQTAQVFFKSVGVSNLSVSKTNNRIFNSTMINTKGIGVYTKWLLDDEKHFTVNISSNRFDNVATAIKFDDWGAYNVVSDNKISHSDTAVYIRGGNQRFTNNTVANSKSIALLIKGGSANPNNGLINVDDNTINHNEKAFRIDSVTRGGVNITNNQINVSNEDSVLIDVSNSTGIVFNGNSISAKSGGDIRTRWINNTNTAMINNIFLDNLHSPIYSGERPVWTNNQFHGSGGAPTATTNFNWLYGNLSIKGAGNSRSGGAANSLNLSSYSTTTATTDAINFFNSGSSTMDTQSATPSGKVLGDINAVGVTNSLNTTTAAARIRFTQTGSSGAGNIPGAITFQTGTSTTAVTQAMLLDSLGRIGGKGVTAPTAWLHLPAGTTTIQPLRFTSGSLNTTPLAGAVEYNSPDLTFVNSGTTRNYFMFGTAKPTAAQFPVSNGTNYTPVTMSGDGTINNSGVFTIGAGKVTAAKADTSSSGLRTGANSLSLSQLQTKFNGYLPLTGGTLSGPLTINGTGNVLNVNGDINASAGNLGVQNINAAQLYTTSSLFVGNSGSSSTGIYFQDVAGSRKWHLDAGSGNWFLTYNGGSHILDVNTSGVLQANQFKSVATTTGTAGIDSPIVIQGNVLKKIDPNYYLHTEDGLIDNINTINTDYTITSSDFAVGKKKTLDLYVYAGDNNVTITMPSAATFAGYTIYITRKDNSANTVTINTVVGANTLTSQYQSRQFNSDTVSWYNH